MAYWQGLTLCGDPTLVESEGEVWNGLRSPCHLDDKEDRKTGGDLFALHKPLPPGAANHVGDNNGGRTYIA